MLLSKYIQLFGVFFLGFYMANAAAFVLNRGHRKSMFAHRLASLRKFLKVTDLLC